MVGGNDPQEHAFNHPQHDSSQPRAPVRTFPVQPASSDLSQRRYSQDSHEQAEAIQGHSADVTSIAYCDGQQVPPGARSTVPKLFMCLSLACLPFPQRGCG